MNDLELAIHVASLAAAVVTRWSHDVIAPEMKGVVNPVTEADREAEAAVIEALGAHRAADAIMAEEGGGTIGPDRTWIVDPLDGTVNFVHGVPHVAVSIALFEAGEPLVGVIHDVFRNDVYSAQRGRGASLNGHPMTVSQTDEIGAGLIATGFPYDRRERADAYAADVAKALRAVRGLRRMGAAALDLAYVAAGRFDGYFERNLAPWDIAAGVLLVTEAGGRVSDLSGAAISIDTFDSVLATNGAIHNQLFDTLRR